MGPHPRFAAALVAGLVIAVASTFWSISVSQDRIGLAVSDLLRVEELGEPVTPADDHLRRVLDAWSGERPWTEDEVATRFGPAFEGITAAAINEQDRDNLERLGRISFAAMIDREPDFVRAVTVSESGIPFVAFLITDDEGRIAGLSREVLPSPPPLRGWATALALVVGWCFLAAGVAAHRFGNRHQSWWLVLGAPVSLAAVLVLSRSPLAYTLGRVVPALAVVVAVWLLVGDGDRVPRWLAIATVGAAAAGVLAPFTRDAALVGHPALIGGFANSATLHRVLLTLSAVLAGTAMAGVAVEYAARLRRSSRWRRPPQWVAVGASALWSVAAFGSAVDSALGHGAWSGASLRAAVWVAYGAVAGAIALGLVSSRWDNPELASLVIDLDADGSELQSALARALEDASLELVTASDDGEALVDTTGSPIDPDRLPAGRTLTLIRSHGKLVGGLVHDAALKIHPARVESIAATAGMALEVSRLNRQVMAQLDDVTASRARIVHASDAARRRIERDLHDGAQQRLVGLGLTLQRARRLAGSAADAERGKLLETAGRELREIIEDVRAVSRGSHPALLSERGLAAALDALAERAPVPVRLDVEPDSLSDDAAATVYFVVAEALTNVAKHAEASTAAVTVARCDGVARVRIADDGRGGAVVTPGSGLQGLDDRVAAAGGALVVRSGPTGTTLEAEIPCG